MAEQKVAVVISIRKKEEIEWLEGIITKHRDFWLITDGKSVKILARQNILSKIPGGKLIVYDDRKPEESALRIYKATSPDMIYMCDNYGVLRAIADFMKFTRVKVLSC